MEFSKYQGAGNDFVIIDNMNHQIRDLSAAAAILCDRKFGIGADGLIAAEPSDTADIRMSYYNSDGSLAGMCGNGLRCFSKFVTDHGLVDGETIQVETGDGRKDVRILQSTPKISRVEVDMGSCGEIRPAVIHTEKQPFQTYFTHLGVPHTVVFCETEGGGMPALDRLTEQNGSDLEFATEFQPDHTNVNFVEILAPDHILCSTWERGAGKTLACGTGACASALISHMEREAGSSIRVTMPGGDVVITMTDDRRVLMEGDAELTFTGSTDLAEDLPGSPR